MARIWKQIMERDRYTTQYHDVRRGHYSVIYTLECGHTQHRKGSEEVKGNRVICKQCESDGKMC